jgi:hypothetical protein
MLHLNKTRIGVLLLVLSLSVFSLNGSQAACLKENQRTETTGLLEQNLYYFAENLEEFQIKAIYRNKDNDTTLKSREYNLSAFITPNMNQIDISGVEPVLLKDFLCNTLNLEIDYSIIKVDLQKKEVKWNKNELEKQNGSINLILSEQDPYWRISNQNGVWGVGIPNIGIPQMIKEILPKKLEDVRIEYSSEIGKVNILNGKITLLSPEDSTYEFSNINLSDLKLSKQLNQQIIKNQVGSSDLEIIANYDFSIPIEKEKLSIKGTVTFAIYIRVIHDIK